MSTPNQLNITINTNVPGHQKITYKPFMTIKDINKNDSNLNFNPLIKLNKSIIEKIPQNVRIKQFFKKGLFQSLLNYKHNKPAKNLTTRQIVI